MKKRTIVIAVFLTCFSIVLFSPLLLKQQQIQDTIAKHITDSFDVKGEIGSIYWRWLPLPAIGIKELHVKSDTYELQVPRIYLYPNWLALFKREVQLGKVKLINPKLTLKSKKSLQKFTPPILPQFKLVITNGEINIPAQYASTKIKHKALSFNSLNVKLATNQQRIKFTLKSKSNFSEKLQAIGRIDLNKHYYRIDIDGQHFNLPEIFYLEDQHYCSLVTTNFSSKIHLEGIGSENYRVSIINPKSPFSFTVAQSPVNIDGFDKLVFTSHGKNKFFNIHKLKLAEPALTISGEVSRSFADNDNTPLWYLDLNAQDVDLAAVRRRLLNTFPDNPITKEVCSIVRGGTAKTARYVIHGPASHFKHLDLMKIWAEAQDVPLYFSDIDLSIDRASGPLTIMNGNLNIENMIGDIGTSHGKNGKLFLDLTDKDDAFFLDIDLDVDLGELQAVLGQIIDEQSFQDEIVQFSDISGRAKGHLHLEDNLYDIDTTVNIEEMHGEGFYDRLPTRFTINNGKLHIYPDYVSWEDLSLSVGNQKVTNSRGKVSWPNQIQVEIEQFEAKLELQQLLQEGYFQTNSEQWRIKDYFSNVVHDISGEANLSSSTFSGPAFRPEEWKFKTEIKAPNIELHTPLLPGAVTTKTFDASLNSENALFLSKFSFLDQTFQMKGNYYHSLFDNWEGNFTIDGLINKKIGTWLKNLDFIDKKIFPRQPFLLKGFTVFTKQPSFQNYEARGDIISQIVEDSPITLQLDINRQKDLAMNSMTFLDGDQHGKLTYNIWQSGIKRTLLSWQGIISAGTLDLFFEENLILSGNLNGAFSRLEAIEDPMQTTYSGYLEGSNLSWAHPDSGNLVKVGELSILGHDNIVDIEKLSLILGDDILNIQGELSTDENQHYLEVDLLSEKLSWENMRPFFTSKTKEVNLKEDKDGEILIQESSSLIPKGMNGKINFNINQFNYSKTALKAKDTDQSETHESEQDTTPPEKPKITTYTWTPLQGTAATIENRNLEINLENSTICGMAMTGTWYLGSRGADSTFNINQTDTPLLFQDTLPCLGIEQSIIDGPFSLKAEFTGEPDNWQKGKFLLKSSEGIIRKMNILSKVFSVVNFTELFAWQKKPDIQGKGLRYSNMQLKSHVDNNMLIFDKATLKGKGVNLSGRGKINMKNLDTDLTFFIAPFKIIDSVVTNVPLVGKAIGGKKKSILTFPVGVKGPLYDPQVNALPPKAIGSAAVELLFDTLTFPVRMFIPEKKDKELEELQEVQPESTKKSNESK